MRVVEFSADAWQASAPGLRSGLASRMEAVGQLAEGLESLASSGNISGRGADAMRAYVREVHVPILQSLLIGLSTFQTAIGVYWDGYGQVDAGGNFRLVKDEYDAHLTRLESGMETLRGFGARLRQISAGAAHLVALDGAGAHAAEATVGHLEGMHSIAKTQQETWEAYEASDPGFGQVQELIAQLSSILSNLGTLTVGRGRSYQAGSFTLTLQQLGQLTTGMLEYCQTNQAVAASGWETLFTQYAQDVEAARREQAGWDLLWDGLQILAGAVITVIGVGLTPFTGGFSLGLTVLGGSLVVGGVNSAINHATIATTGNELNLIGMAAEQVNRWYDINVATPAANSGVAGFQFLAGAAAAVGDLVAGTLHVNVKEIGDGIHTLATDQAARSELWNQLTTTVAKIVNGDAYTTGYAATTIASLLIPGAAAAKFTRPGGLLHGAGKIPGLNKPVKITTPNKTTSALNLGKDMAGPGVTVVKRDFTPASKPSWTPHADTPPDPHKAAHGDPVADHGVHRSYPAITDTNRRTFDLFSDPLAPWGRGPEGAPYTKTEYDQRFTEAAINPGTGHNYDNYPPNDGAVPGTRRDYDDLGNFVREHGNTVDRIGKEDGPYLGVRVDGKPATFEQRSLPVNSLELPYSAYRLADEWPPGAKDWTIEYAEIAPAFGRPGGGYQLLIRDPKGNVMRVEDLLENGVLVREGVAK